MLPDDLYANWEEKSMETEVGEQILIQWILLMPITQAITEDTSTSSTKVDADKQPTSSQE